MIRLKTSSVFSAFSDILCICDSFSLNPRSCHILSSWTMHDGCVFTAGNFLYRTCMSQNSESVRRNASVHRLDFSLHSQPKELEEVESETLLTPRGKIPSTGWLKHANAASCRIASPMHYQLSYPNPHCMRQGSQHIDI